MASIAPISLNGRIGTAAYTCAEPQFNFGAFCLNFGGFGAFQRIKIFRSGNYQKSIEMHRLAQSFWNDSLVEHMSLVRRTSSFLNPRHHQSAHKFLGIRGLFLRVDWFLLSQEITLVVLRSHS